MEYLTIDEVLEIHDDIIAESGGLAGVRDISGLESVLNLPQMEMFGGELYPTLESKAAILGFAMIINHPFMDGNKRIGHAAMEVFLDMNGFGINASVDEQEQVILKVAAGEMTKEEFTDWLKTKTVKLSN